MQCLRKATVACCGWSWLLFLTVTPSFCIAASLYWVRDIDPGSGNGVLNSFYSAPNYLLFWGYDGTNGLDGNPWRSDARQLGTTQIKAISGSGAQQFPGVLGGDITDVQFFTFDDGLGDGEQMWRTDGTSSGTYRLTSFSPGSVITQADFIPFGNVNYFLSDAGCNNAGNDKFCFWKNDATTASVAMPDSNIRDGASTAILQKLVFVGHPSESVADDGLYVSDGTVPGSTLIYPDVEIAEVAAVNDHLFFVASDAASGSELWVSDLTSVGTHLVRDINPGAASSSPQQLTRVADTLFFTAIDQLNGRELWKSDGSLAGTTRVSNIGSGILDAKISSLQSFKAARGAAKAFFFANDGSHGLEPWISDGTPAGTFMLADIRSGSGDSAYTQFAAGIAASSKLYFTAIDNTGYPRLFGTDGTTGGTSIIDSTNIAEEVVGTVGSELYVEGGQPGTGNELLALDAQVYENHSFGATTVCTRPEKVIGDVETINTQFSMPKRGEITRVNFVSVDLVHEHLGDLTVKLTHGGTGTSVTLLNRPKGGQCTGRIMDIAFADATIGLSGDASCSDNRQAYTSNNSYVPTQRLSAFVGEQTSGIWNLSITDSALGGSGTLHQFCLSITDDQIFADEFGS